ncbi:hypothetical protein LCGC14_0960840 [marine sediment metagenome]|uniref:Uncharacterized protein n=1 Tax=marine sediment metagenome TaxID=412755 RepID=A0A0F9RL34_9ZZZZ
MTGFPDFWEIMKRCRARYSNPRKLAERAWDKCIKAGAVESDMILGAKGYLAHVEEENTEPQFVCMTSVFLNQWRFEQYVEVAREIEEEQAAKLLQQRRDYYKYGWRDEKRGEAERDLSAFDAAVKEAYDMGRHDASAPRLQVVK